jgi:ubiquitin C-terminal hydrolase
MASQSASTATPSGLNNVGSTCYLNTLLQCWYHLSGFRDVIYGFDPALSPIVHGLQILWKCMEARPSVSPAAFVELLRKRMPSFEWLEQNDMHEAAMLILDMIQKDVGRPINTQIDPLTETATKWDRVCHKAMLSWNDMFKNDMSPLISTIYGQTIQQIICGHCKTIHHRYQPFSIWEVDLDMRPSSLIDSIQSSIRHEILNDTASNVATNHSITWTCDKCNQKAPSEKTTAIWSWPRTLMICIKRFHFTPSGRMIKNSHHMKIPERMDLTSLYEKQQAATYELCSVGNHRGDLNYGHYIASVKSANNQTYVINDQMVKQISGLYTDDAYMLFYQRVAST